MINKIGIDIDTHNTLTNKHFIQRMKKIGKIIKAYKTSNGFHYRILLPESVKFERSCELRFFCGDDPKRILMDILRVWNGLKQIDILFNKKWISSKGRKRFDLSVEKNHKNHKNKMKTCRLCMEIERL